jgi:hypothetical protein
MDEYLVSALDETVDRTGARISTDTRAYVMFLLRSQLNGRYWPDEMLSMRIAHAFQGGILPSERRARYREVGDAALILSGLWWMREEDRPRRSSNLDLYLEIGPLAYGQLRKTPFAELSRQFGALVDVLVRMQMTGASDPAGDIVRLFRIWERTRSTHAARILADRGIFVSMIRSSTPS